MKKTLLIFSITLVFAACTTGTQSGAIDTTKVAVDTLAVQPGVEPTVPTDTVK